MLSGFKGAIGTAGLGFLIAGLGAYVALLFAHPVYVVVVAPAIVLGAGYVIWRRRPMARAQGDTSIASMDDARRPDET